MKKTINLKAFLTFAAFGAMFCFAVFAAPEKASAQTPPAGSYQQTCQKFSFSYMSINSGHKAALVADCRRKNGSFVQAVLEGYYLCSPNSISNQDGALTCTMNENLPSYQAVLKVMPKVFQRFYGNSQQKTVNQFIAELINYKWDAQYFSGLDENKAMEFLRMQNSQPNIDYVLKPIVQRAVHDVYGRDAYQGDFDKYLPRFVQKASSYEQIRALEMMYLNGQDKNLLRGLAIGYAFNAVRDKPPTKDERDYWLSRSESYQQIVDAISKK